MQFTLAFVAAALATLAVAAPTNGGSSDVCSTGSQQCCKETMASNSSKGSLLVGLLGLDLGNVTGLLGLQCTSIAGSGCSSQAVCCQNNANGGLISIGCVPIQL